MCAWHSKHWGMRWSQENHVAFLQELNHSAVGALLDIAHATLHRLNVPEYLKAIRPFLVEIHAHNNHGQHDDHLGLHEGVIDYRQLLKMPEMQDIPIIMEIKSYEEILATLQWLVQTGLV